MAYFGRLKHYFIENLDELVANAGHLRPFLRVYDEKESQLFNSRSRGESKILSNFHPSSVPLPWRGKYFTSVEAMIFYTYIEDNCKNPKWESKKQEVLDLILNSKDGREVKEINRQSRLYSKVRKATVEQIGENAACSMRVMHETEAWGLNYTGILSINGKCCTHWIGVVKG